MVFQSSVNGAKEFKTPARKEKTSGLAPRDLPQSRHSLNMAAGLRGTPTKSFDQKPNEWVDPNIIRNSQTRSLKKYVLTVAPPKLKPKPSPS